jgi:hypothetical protein
MYYGGSHLGFPIGIKNIKFVENLPMIIPGPMNDHWKVLYKVYVFYVDRKSKMAATAIQIIPGQFGFNCPSGFREEAF